MRTLMFRRPDDWHVHFRDGAILDAVVADTARAFGRAIVMPNLVPPVTTAAAAWAYRARIQAAVPPGVRFTPLMTCYLTDSTDAADLVAGHADGVFTAAKLYPAHATTNSSHGVTSIEKLTPVFEAMGDAGMPLLIHGEVTHGDIFDREKLFIDEVLRPLLDRVPALRIVLEHVTTREGVAVVQAHRDRMGATITPQHLAYNRNDLLVGGVRPHLYCLPVLKRDVHQQALRQTVAAGDANFFLGTDSAPHLRHLKENACGCAGVYSAPVAVEAYLEVFADLDALDHFEAFASLNGPRFYRLAPNEERVTYQEVARAVPPAVAVDASTDLTPLRAGESMRWSAVAPAS